MSTICATKVASDSDTLQEASDRLSHSSIEIRRDPQGHQEAQAVSDR